WAAARSRPSSWASAPRPTPRRPACSRLPSRGWPRTTARWVATAWSRSCSARRSTRTGSGSSTRAGPRRCSRRSGHSAANAAWPPGLINSIGLPNKGLEGFLASDLPQLAELPVPLIVSVMGFSRDELATLVAALAERDEVAMIELNFSCPNVETGLIMGADPSETSRSVERLRSLTDKPLIVKLTPNATDPAGVARAAEAAGADALSL